MNQQQFELFQHSADDEFLEEAQAATMGKKRYKKILAFAVCFCAVALVTVVWKPWLSDVQTQLPNPIEEVDAAALQRLGYRIEIPQNATNVVYRTIKQPGTEGIPMAQVDYDLKNQAYTYRALKTKKSEDISGIYQTWKEDLSWKNGNMQLRLCANDSDAWVGWYSPEESTQWCLSGRDNGQALLNDAFMLARDLGIDFSTAPKDAQNVSVNAFEQDGLTVAETRFTFDEINYVYRVASTPEVTLTDISGDKGEYAGNAQAKVSWCDAQLYFTQGAGGKILWLDVVPGLVYSLSAENGASAEMLTTMANSLFVPAQGDVG